MQFVKLAGAVVVAGCRRRGAGLGADEVVDYTTTDVREWVMGRGGGVDLVVGCIGRKPLEDAWWTVKEGVEIVSILQSPEPMRPAEMKGDIKNHFFIMKSNAEQLQKITELMESGIGKPAVDVIRFYSKPGHFKPMAIQKIKKSLTPLWQLNLNHYAPQTKLVLSLRESSTELV